MKKVSLRNLISVLIITVMVTGVFTLSIMNDDAVQAATKKVKVTYKANGGKFSKKKYAKKKSFTKKIKKGKKIGKLPKITKKGYKFKGWYTKKSKGKKVTKKTKIKKNTKLYARWSAKSYTLNFDANGGQVSKASQKVKYDSKYGTLPTPTKTGSIFQGWYTKKSGGDKVNAADIYKTAGSQTLYAHWNDKYLVNQTMLNMLGKSVDDITKEVTDLTYEKTTTLPDGKELEVYYSGNSDTIYCFEGNSCKYIDGTIATLFPNNKDNYSQIDEYIKAYKDYKLAYDSLEDGGVELNAGSAVILVSIEKFRMIPNTAWGYITNLETETAADLTVELIDIR